MGVMPAQPLVSIDAVPFILHEGQLRVLTAVREFAPHQGEAALPGVLLNSRERLAEAVTRALATKAGVSESVNPVQVAVFDDFQRDDRGPTLSIAHLVILTEVPADPRVVLCPIRTVPALPFDHNKIIERAAGALLDSLWIDKALTRQLLGETFSTYDVTGRMTELAAAAGRPEPYLKNVGRSLSSNRNLAKQDAVEVRTGRPAATWRWQDTDG